MRLLSIPSLQRHSIREAGAWHGTVSRTSVLQKLLGTSHCLRCKAATDGEEKVVWIQTRSKVRFSHNLRRQSPRVVYMTTFSICIYMICTVKALHQGQYLAYVGRPHDSP